MKKSVFVALISTVFVAACSGQTSCVQLHYRNTTLCTFADGSGTLTDYDSSGFTDSHYADPEAWNNLRTKLTEEDTAKIKERDVQLAALNKQQAEEEKAREAHFDEERRAWKIAKKKECVSSGFEWKAGHCKVKRDK
jgi:hypothetical protein